MGHIHIVDRSTGAVSINYWSETGLCDGSYPVLPVIYAAMRDEATRGLGSGIRIRVRTTGKLFNLVCLRSSKKVFEELVCELLIYADDCAIEAHCDTPRMTCS